MTQDEVLRIFRDSGALLEGHFILRSGLHSRQYFQCALALQQMPVVEKIGRRWPARPVRSAPSPSSRPRSADWSSARRSRGSSASRFIFSEKEEGKLVLRRGFKIAPGEKILVVEDVVTKGGRVQETIDIVRAHGGNVVGVATIVDRSNGTVNFGVPFASLIALQVETFKPDKLPPDLAAIPVVKPGSK
jgi:orotate phosphoribosyltransferase